MTMLSAIASPGQRWKMFLPGAASIQGDVLSMRATSDLIRSRWLSAGARGSPKPIQSRIIRCNTPTRRTHDSLRPS
jgi:hypothetical protein